MTLLDRYIFRSALFTCLAAVAVFAFVLITGNVVRDLVGPGLAGQLTWTEFGRLTLLLVPFVISYALPMGILTGVLLTLGRLSADSELTAMRAAGVSLKRIAAPILLLGLIGAAAGLPVNFRAMPWARVQYERVLTGALRANPLSFIVPRTFVTDFPGYVIYVSDRAGPQLKQLWVWRVDSQKRATSLWHADTGEIGYDDANFALILTLHGVQAESLDELNPESFHNPPRIATADSWEPMSLPLSQVLGRQSHRQKLDWMTYPELLKERAAREARPYPDAKEKARQVMQVTLTLVNKVNLAVAALSFAFVGVPLGIKVSRRETSANLGVAVALALGYYFLTVVVGWLDRRPDLRPDLLLWLPNLIFFAIGLRLFRRVDQH